VVNALHFLLDDRTFVEIGRHIMRRRAYQLHAAVERLVIRLGALEAGQERVVDIDRPPGQLLTQARRQDLHIARQHDQIDLVLVDHFEDARFLGRLFGR